MTSGLLPFFFLPFSSQASKIEIECEVVHVWHDYCLGSLPSAWFSDEVRVDNWIGSGEGWWD